MKVGAQVAVSSNIPPLIALAQCVTLRGLLVTFGPLAKSNSQSERSAAKRF